MTLQEITIKLPDIVYKSILDNNKIYGNWENDLLGILCNAIAHGTPLPEGHGRLIDADELNRMMYHKSFELDSDMQKWDSGCWIRYKMFENSMEEMLTIIEADAESEGKA